MTKASLRMIMVKAHKLARKMEGDYQARLALGLRLAWAEKKMNGKKISIKDLEKMILEKDNTKTEIAVNEWKKYGKHRIYINVKVKNRRRGVTSFIDLNTNEVVTKQNGKCKDWIMSLVEAVDEIVKEHKQAIIELAKVKKVEKSKKSKTAKKDKNAESRKLDMHAEFLGIDNNLSSEDFEDITGMKKFDESYF